ncbi:hypothetical protein EJ03DRAFT_329199 [Teratosphaeria nubilosa]|uniref:Translation initiation factor eIF2B subunit gamma n=1 Tax=Teratosphaeria nubilosa TaxID=161662 RepID=A0A6G1L5A9_9PEZI|nr:hypothetical protein EJ03DRAFT_329199 [Teratosphaeria nubilosa]
MPHATVPSAGLQALILCGPGVSLNTFTSNPKDLPKALLPIANRPMVWYPLEWCHRMGIGIITLVTPHEAAPALEHALATHPALTSLPKPQPEVVAPEELEQTTGTGELLRLREVQKAIKGDFVLLPCDLVSEMHGTRILQQWMTLNPSTTSGRKSKKGGLSVFYPTQGLEGISSKKDETDFLATIELQKSAVPAPQGSLRSDIEEIVMSMPSDTLDDKLAESKGHLRLRQSLLSKHGKSKMRMKHRDAHIYIFPHWVKDFAARNEKFDSISEDVLGWWAKAGWQQGLPEKLGLDSILEDKKASDLETSGHLDDREAEVDPASLSSTKSTEHPVQPLATFASRVGNAAILPKDIPVPPLLAYVQPTPSPTSPQPLIRRVDTSAQLAAISLYLAKQPADHALAHEHKVHPTASIGMQTRISQEDSLVAENVKMGIRCNIKESVIGNNCEIGNNVRLTKCVLMDGVVVGDGVQMMNCIVGRRAKFEGMKAVVEAGAAEGEKPKKKNRQQDDEEERTRLTECEVAPGYVVEWGYEGKGEKMMAFDTEGDLDDFEDEEGGGEEA